MRPSDDPAPTPDEGEEAGVELGVADDGMAPLINNTGADGTGDEDADASSG